MPGFFMTTRHLVPIDQIYRCLGLIARIDFLSESTTNHIELIQDEIHKKSLRLKGIFQYFQAEKAYGNRDFSKHIDLLRSTAESGYTPAMCHFAGLFFNGDLIQKNLEGYFYWYREAANQNDALAIYQLAGCYARGTGIEQDLNIGLSLLKESASKGCWAAVFGWASYFRFGWQNCFLVSQSYNGYEQVNLQCIDPEKALSLYHLIANQALECEKSVLANTYYHLALMYQDGIGTAQYYEESVFWYQKSADLGNSIAINNLADKYEHGLGVEQDLHMAVELYMQVADQLVAAALSLGRMYLEGRGVEKDLQKSKLHLNTVINTRIDGIESMQLEAMQLLAVFTQDDPILQARKILENPTEYSIEQINEQTPKIDALLHLPECEELFFKLYLLNARKGEASSQAQVGDWYLKGMFTDRNLEEAAFWIQKAADQKDEYAEAKIGCMYEKGLYFNKDLNLAKKWYERALRIPSKKYYPEYINGKLNSEYLKEYQDMNSDALEGLARIEMQKPKVSKWKFWLK